MCEDRLLNWEQACALLGCKRSYFYNLINSGILPAVRVGTIKGVRVYESACLAFIEKRSARDTSPSR